MGNNWKWQCNPVKSENRMISLSAHNIFYVLSVSLTEKLFSYFSNNAYVVGTPKKGLNETILLSTKNIW